MEKLKRARGTCKSQLTRLTNVLKEKESISLSKAKVKLEMLEKTIQDFQNTQDLIEQEVAEEEIPNELKERETFEDTYAQLKAELLDIIQGFEDAARPSPPAPTAVIASETLQQDAQTQGHRSKLNLPKLSLPMFDGSYEKWTAFYDLYKATIHDDNSLRDIQKFFYLKGALQGEALRIIDQIPINDGNYCIALTTLKERYGNDKLILKAHLKCLFSINKCQAESSTLLKNLVDTVNINVRALENLGYTSNDLSDAILKFMLNGKLDQKTRELWETQAANKDKKSLKDMLEFLAERSNILQALPEPRVSNNNSNSYANKSKRFENARVNVAAVTPAKLCPCCKESHALEKCKKFLEKSIPERFDYVQKERLCFNCLASGHSSNACREKKCSTCYKRHHVVLHSDAGPRFSGTSAPSTSSTKSSTDKTEQVNAAINENANILLATAIVFVEDANGVKHKARIFLDNGSQPNFITQRMVKLLKLNTYAKNVKLQGISTSSTTNYAVTFKLFSRVSNFEIKIDALITEVICENMPSSYINVRVPNFEGLSLADPRFNVPDSIDILLGGQFALDIFTDGYISRTHKMFSLRNTVFGWIAAGPFPSLSASTVNSDNVSVNHCAIANALEKFWQLEELPEPIVEKAEDRLCEEYFKQTVIRKPEGRFSVRLPFKKSPSMLGKSRETAMKILLGMRRRLTPVQRESCDDFLREYKILGHMSPVNEIVDNTPHFYLPYHPVFKETSATTKTRVVFNGSKPTSSGVSINDVLMVGPVLQKELFTILIRFRSHVVAICADVAMMYRQVEVHKDDRDFQRILAFDEDGKIQDFQLNTVTYGMASSAFLAIRSMFELAALYEPMFPAAAEVIRNDSYVDDIVSGAATKEEASMLVQELDTMLKEGGFVLRKWSSNEPCVLDELNTNTEFLYNLSDDISTLGLKWNPKEDTLQLKGNLPTGDLKITKRTILAESARLFDPLGILAPVTVKAKILLQQLWQEGFDWDEDVTGQLKKNWIAYCNSLNNTYIRVPRLIFHADVQLHGFCDASISAYAACIYVRSQCNDCVKVNLLCAKTKVAPLKTKLTVPRLELSAALLLAKLMNKVTEALDHCLKTFLWSDSMIALAWITQEPSIWKQFVSSRVAEIQRLTDVRSWRHVSTHDNPADLASRGILGHHIATQELWWNGPSFLQQGADFQDVTIPVDRENAKIEMKKPKFNCFSIQFDDTSIILKKYSSARKAIRIIGYCLRFKENSQAIPPKRTVGPITLCEFHRAIKVAVKAIQTSAYASEIAKLQRPLKQNQEPNVGKRSSLLSLSPFLDKEGILRVGGRLAHAELPYARKHPILLPSHNHFVKCMLRERHIELLHAPAHALQSNISEKFWITGARSLAKSIVRECVTCRKANATPSMQLMGQLPAVRVNPTFPFQHVGVDFGGPLLVRYGNRRSRITQKAYICVFICLTTKAIHLEAVTALSANAFLDTLDRFVGRRGRPIIMYSDNGTNFKGAERELRDICAGESIQNHLVQEDIEWRFIPPAAPHQGGIWEAAVKSTKGHLAKVVGNTTLTIEELFTLLVRIEGMLNSRPMYALSNDPNDLSALTPSHLINLRPVSAIPQRDLTKDKLTPRQRFQFLQQLAQHFWKRWTKEYLNMLQPKSKWHKKSRNFQEGDLVIIESDVIPTRWRLGRITKVHTGEDGLVRSVDIKTATGHLTRPITKIALLFQEENDC